MRNDCTPSSGNGGKILHKVALTAALAALILFTPSSWAEKAEKKGEGIIARVNGVAIPYSDLLVEVNRRLPFISFHGNIRPEKMDRLVEDSVEELILNELKFQEAKKKNLKIPQKQIDQRIEKKSRRSSLPPKPSKRPSKTLA